MTEHDNALVYKLIAAKAVLFDWDGTTIDSNNNQPLAYAIQHTALNDIGLTVTEDFVKKHIGLSYRAFVTAALKQHNPLTHNQEIDEKLPLFNTAAIDHLKNAYNEKIRLHDGIKDVFATLASPKRGIFIISNANSDFIKQSVSLTGLSKYVSDARILSPDVVGTSKPNPSQIHAACKAFNITATQAVFFGDTNADMAAGKDAGVFTILVGNHAKIDPTFAPNARIHDYKVLGRSLQRMVAL